MSRKENIRMAKIIIDPNKKYQTVKNGKQYKKSVATHHIHLIKPPKCYLKVMKNECKII